MTLQRKRASIDEAVRRAHVVGAAFPVKPLMGVRAAAALSTEGRRIDALGTTCIGLADAQGVLVIEMEGPDGIDPELGPYVDRRLSIAQVERLINANVEMRLLPSGIVRIPVNV